MLQITLTYKGNTINLNDGAVTLIKDPWTLVTPGPGDESAVDRFDLKIRSATPWDKAREINRAFQYAESHQTGEDVCFVNVAVKEGLTLYRSKVISGSLLFEPGLGRGLKFKALDAQLVIEHDPWWEGAKQTLALSNLNGSNLLNGINVYNCNDAAGTSPNRRCNYFDIAAAAIGGELATPLSLEITNAQSTYGVLSNLWIGMNKTNPLTAKVTYEAEAAIGSTTQSASTASGGSYTSGDITVVIPYAANLLLTWSLTAAQVAAFDGQFVKILIRQFASLANYARYQVRVNRDTRLLWSSEWKYPDEDFRSEWIELATVRMPPSMQGLSNQGALQLQLLGNADVNGGPVSYGFDDLMLLPLDGYQFFSFGADVNQRLNVDNSGEQYYTSDSAGANAYPCHKVIGDPMLLEPNQAHRIHFACHWQNSVPIAGYVIVKATYRERKASL